MDDYLYITFPEPLEGIKLDFGYRPPGTKIYTIPSVEDYYEEEQEIEPMLIEFSLGIQN